MCESNTHPEAASFGKEPRPCTYDKKGAVSRAPFVHPPRPRRALFLELHDDVHRGADAHGDIDGLRLVAWAGDGNRMRAGICHDAAWVPGEVLARAEVLVVDIDGGVLGRDLESHARAVARRAGKGLGPGVHPLFGHPLAIVPSVGTRRALRNDTRCRRGLFLRLAHASISLAVTARHDVDARASPPPRGVEGVPAPAPPIRVVTRAAAAMPTAVPAAAVRTAAAPTAAVGAADPASAAGAARATRVARPAGMTTAAAMPRTAAGLRCLRGECHGRREDNRRDQRRAKEARRSVRDHLDTPGRDFGSRPPGQHCKDPARNLRPDRPLSRTPLSARYRRRERKEASEAISSYPFVRGADVA